MTLASTRAGPVTLGHVLYHPEAVVLVAKPLEALAPVHEAIPVRDPVDDEECRIPHVTVAYRAPDRPAAPVIDALGHVVPERTVAISSVSLVVQWGPERDWETPATVPIGTVQVGADSMAAVTRRSGAAERGRTSGG